MRKLAEGQAVIVIYQAEHFIDAHLIKGLLEQHGIEVQVIGGDLTGGAGELPAFGLIKLAVDPLQIPKAQQLLEQYKNGELELPDHLIPE